MLNIQKFAYEDYLYAQKVFKNGGNVTDSLKQRLDIGYNTDNIIAIAYDLQAGTYSAYAADNESFYSARADEISACIGSFIGGCNSIIDVGTGELTMFSRILERLNIKSDAQILATDISWSRLHVGKRATLNSIARYHNFRTFVSDMARLGLPSKSIDVVMSDHSIEPNGARLDYIIPELFRCAIRYCIFTEPSDDLQSAEGQARMRQLGYIFNLEDAIQRHGGRVVYRKDIHNNYNDLNRARLLIVEPPQIAKNAALECSLNVPFTFPGTDSQLIEDSDYLYSEVCGVLFPKGVRSANPFGGQGNFSLTISLLQISQTQPQRGIIYLDDFVTEAYRVIQMFND